METNDKQLLFTALSQEESASICGGSSISGLLGLLNYLNQSSNNNTLTLSQTEPDGSTSSTPASVSPSGLLNFNISLPNSPNTLGLTVNLTDGVLG